VRDGCKPRHGLFTVLCPEPQLRILPMSQATASAKITTPRAARPTSPRRLHPLPLRIMHWINAVAIFIMIGSGWKIYNDDALDSIVIGKWAQYGLQ
jgi:hypothetical protein